MLHHHNRQSTLLAALPHVGLFALLASGVLGGAWRFSRDARHQLEG